MWGGCNKLPKMVRRRCSPVKSMLRFLIAAIDDDDSASSSGNTQEENIALICTGERNGRERMEGGGRRVRREGSRRAFKMQWKL